MRSAVILASLGIAAAAPSALHLATPRQASSSAQNVVYWGATNNENNDLATYCTSSAGIDILVLAFLDIYGYTGNYPAGNIGDSCYVGTTGVPQQCSDLASAISTCQAAGIKTIVSLGGAAGSYSLESQAQAETIGQYLWDAYGKSGNTTVQRPFGDVIVDGWDFDLEVDLGSQYYQYLISTLRSNFASDSSRKYYITGAPQCPIPEPNMQVIIDNSQFDYLWVQFYNNPGCSTNTGTNFNDWVSNIAGTPSSGAQIFIGVPASTLGATGSASGAQYYLAPAALASLVGNFDSNPKFGGIMMWDAGYSDANVNGGCTYAQEAKSILRTGAPCGGSSSGSGSGSGTTTTSTAAPTKTSSSGSGGSSGTVPEWGQCGGQGYTGPTQCASPYTCVESSEWWSACEA